MLVRADAGGQNLWDGRVGDDQESSRSPTGRRFDRGQSALEKILEKCTGDVRRISGSVVPVPQVFIILEAESKLKE